ncbi:MAG TPA: carbohydrate porin [Stellaceae bacterium]|nr:carbohydrate porin [Stellaceae bacterium]
MGGRRLGTISVALGLCALAFRPAAHADDDAETWSAHGQLTGVYQAYPSFHSPYQGQNSLSGDTQIRETISGTAYLGRRLPWQGGALYFDPEFNQGFGLSRTLGVDGFPNGEASKAGFDTPKPNVARLYVQQIFGLGGDTETLDPGPNQLGDRVDVARVTVTAGKLAASDIFDGNQYAHDARTEFMNSSLWEATAWDYPADAKGYTDGVAAELNQKRWALRGGWFLEPKIANQRDLDPRFAKRYGTVVELETRHDVWGEPGILRTLVFANRAPMGNLDQAVALAQATGMPANIALVRRDRWKAGFAVNLEQSVTDDLGLFARLSWNDGRTEGWAFTDIDRSLSIGASLKGARWNRPRDTVGVAAAVNGLSKPARNFFAAGGLGILAGDGRLSYAAETIVESYYSFSIIEPVNFTLDYQFVANPAFNSARGPVSIFAARLHLEY